MGKSKQEIQTEERTDFMERMEMVEKLRERANISMEEARDILERNQWDMLDAMVELERQGKINAGARTTAGESKAETYETVNPTVTGNAYHEKKKSKRGEDERAWKRLRQAVRNLLRMGLDNQFVITRDGEEMARVPVLVPICLAVAAFWLTVAALFIGLIFNLRYSFEGKELGKDSINKTMDKAGEFAQEFVSNVTEPEQGQGAQEGPEGSAENGMGQDQNTQE